MCLENGVDVIAQVGFALSQSMHNVACVAAA